MGGLVLQQVVPLFDEVEVAGAPLKLEEGAVEQDLLLVEEGEVAEAPQLVKLVMRAPLQMEEGALLLVGVEEVVEAPLQRKLVMRAPLQMEEGALLLVGVGEVAGALLQRKLEVAVPLLLVGAGGGPWEQLRKCVLGVLEGAEIF